MSILNSVIGRLRGEIAANQRLLYGLMAIAALIVLYGVSGLSSMRRRSSADYVQAVERLDRVRRIATEKGWDSRKQAAENYLKKLQAEIPTSDSVGLAQATFQGWLRNVVIATDPEIQVHMGTPQQVSDNSPLWEIPAQLAGTIPASKSLEILRRIESRKDLAVIKRTRISAVSPSSFTVDVVAYYRVRNEGSEP